MDPTHSGALALKAALGEGQGAAAAALKTRGNDAMVAKNYALAAGLYTEAMAADPNSVVSLNNRAQAYVKLGAYEKAVVDATEVIRRTRGSAPQAAVFRKALFRRAFSLRQQAMPDVAAALADFRELAVEEPDNRSFQAELLRTEAQVAAAAAPAKPPQPPATAAAEEGASLGLTATSTTRKGRRMVVQEVEEDADDLPDVPVPAAAAAARAGAGDSDAAFHAAASAEAEGQQAKKKAAHTRSPTKITLKRPELPAEPPKTVYELEKVWRALRSYPDLFCAYLTSFKKSTYKKVFKDSVSSDLLSSVFASLLQHAEAAPTCAVLKGLAGTAGFGMMLQLLPAADIATLRAIAEKVGGEPAEALRQQYKL